MARFTSRARAGTAIADRPCRRRARLGDQPGASAGGGQASQRCPRARHGRDRPDHRPACDGLRPAARCTGSTPGAARGKRVETLTARATVLATGGAGRASPIPQRRGGRPATALRWRGARGADLQHGFMQFHPTCLYDPEVKHVLITEAVRGEGGILKHPLTGHRFMPDYDGAPSSRRATSSPARSTMRSSATGSTMSSSTSRTASPSSWKAHFPNIYEKLIGLGIDITKEPIRHPGAASAYLRRGRGERRPRRKCNAAPGTTGIGSFVMSMPRPISFS